MYVRVATVHHRSIRGGLQCAAPFPAPLLTRIVSRKTAHGICDPSIAVTDAMVLGRATVCVARLDCAAGLSQQRVAASSCAPGGKICCTHLPAPVIGVPHGRRPPPLRSCVEPQLCTSCRAFQSVLGPAAVGEHTPVQMHELLGGPREDSSESRGRGAGRGGQARRDLLRAQDRMMAEKSLHDSSRRL